MAKARTACDWCKMRRVCEEVQVAMRGRGDMLSSGDILYPVIFARDWKLCSECRLYCEARLYAAFGDKPE
jgi:hypothetical protein